MEHRVWTFEPADGVSYKYDYVGICGKINELLEQRNIPGAMSAVRECAEGDFFFFVYFVLGHTFFNTPFHVPLIYELAIDNDMTADFWAREHGKSTIITRDLTMWEILKNPEETVGIFSYNRAIAKSNLLAIKTTLETNELIRFLWSGIIPENPDKDVPKWSLDDGICLIRKSIIPDATVEAWGMIDGMPTGRHFGILVYDDVVTKNNVGTPEQIQKVKEMFSMSQNLSRRGGKKRVIGTTYHFADLHAEMQKAGIWKCRIRPGREGGEESGKSVWLTEEEMNKKRREMGKYDFYSQILMKPIADDEKTFRIEWLKYYTVYPGKMNKYIVVDPAGTDSKTSDYTVMWVFGVDAQKNFFLLDGVRARISLKEKWNELNRLVEKWTPMLVGYERYGMQGDVAFMEGKMESEGFYFNLRELNHIKGAVSKRERIEALVPLFEEGKIKFPHVISALREGKSTNLVQELIAEEFLEYPFPHHDDMLDALARMIDPRMEIIFPFNPIPEVQKKKWDPFAVPKKSAVSWMGI